MDITQHQLDLFKQHFPGEESIQGISLADIRAHAASAPVAWHAMDLGDARGGGGGGLPVQTLDHTGLSDCEKKAGWLVVDAILLVIGGVGLRKTVRAETVERVAAAAKPVLPKIQELARKVAGKDESTPWARAWAVVEIVMVVRDGALLGAVIAAITSSLTWWDAVLFGIQAIFTVVAAVATDGLALAAEIVLLLVGAAFWIKDCVDAVQTCNKKSIADKTPAPALPPSPDPTPYEPTFGLRTADGHLLSVVDGGGLGRPGVAVTSTATSVGTDEVFTLVPVDATARTFALRTAGGRYVTAVNGGGMGGPNDDSSPIHTDTRELRSWERLHPIQQADGDDRFAFATPSGRYLTAVGGGGVGPDATVPLNTHATTIGTNETFSFLATSSDGPAVVRWGGGSDTHLRVYDQDDDGQLYELIHEPTGVWTPNPLGVYAVPGTGLAAVQWADGTGLHIRVYFQDRSDNLCETGWNTTGGWMPSRTLQPAAPGTNIAAVCWSDGTGTSLRVYYQDATDYLAEYALDPGIGWHGPGRLMPAAPGTAVAALARTDKAGVHLEVFTQNTAGAITSLSWNPNVGWGSAVALFPAQAATGLAAVQWTDDKGRLQKRVYAEAWDGHVFECPYDGGPGWGSSKILADLGNRESGLAAVHWTGSDGNHVRVYYTVGGTVWELPYDRASGWGPVLKLPVPTPAKV